MIPARGEKISVSKHAFSSVICRDDAKLVHRPSDRDVNWMSPVQGKLPPKQVKEPYGNFDMVTCMVTPATRSVPCTPADNARKRAPGSM